jgi:hypothetical protein
MVQNLAGAHCGTSPFQNHRRENKTKRQSREKPSAPGFPGKRKYKMSNAIISAPLGGSNYLVDIAARIKAEHQAVAASLKRSIEHAIAAGELLNEAKEHIPHGQWLPWLREHCGVTPRSAQGYMKLARNRAEIEGKCETISHFTISEALALLSKRSHDNDEPPPPGSSFDEVWEWCGRQIDVPFNDWDFDQDGVPNHRRYITTKMLGLAGVPANVAICLTLQLDYDAGINLADVDEIVEAIKILAPIAKGEKPLACILKKTPPMVAAIEIAMTAKFVLGSLLIALEQIEKMTDERYEKEREKSLQQIKDGIEQARASNRLLEAA